MKILVCTDGSAPAQKAVEQASIIAGGCNVSEVAIVHVYEDRQDERPLFITSDKQEELVKKVKEEYEAERKLILENALKIFEEKNIKAQAILKRGHPAHAIVSLASAEGFDMIVLGSRGLGDIGKLFLGSVSNAVIHEARNCSVVIVK